MALSSRRRKPSETRSEKGRHRRYLFFLVPLVLVIAVLGYVASQPPGSASPSVGNVAPDFELEVVGPNGLTGETLKLSSLRGRVVFLEFMESWCTACREVAPAVESIREDYESKGVVFISVAGTDRGADADSTAAFIREYRTQWTYVLDSDKNIFSRYSIEGTPTFFIIDRDGVITSTYKGVTTSLVLTSALDATLGG
jgi:thiol-disulfide isomerase/thioredoxin